MDEAPLHLWRVLLPHLLLWPHVFGLHIALRTHAVAKAAGTRSGFEILASSHVTVAMWCLLQCVGILAVPLVLPTPDDCLGIRRLGPTLRYMNAVIAFVGTEKVLEWLVYRVRDPADMARFLAGGDFGWSHTGGQSYRDAAYAFFFDATTMRPKAEHAPNRLPSLALDTSALAVSWLLWPVIACTRIAASLALRLTKAPLSFYVSFATFYFAYDACETVFHAFSSHDVLDAPFLARQLLFFGFAVNVYLQLELLYKFCALFGMAVLDQPWASWEEPLFAQPWAPRGIGDFWGRRWHACFKQLWIALWYRPAKFLVEFFAGNLNSPRKGHVMATRLLKSLPALAVYFASGVTHEYMLYMIYRVQVPQAAGNGTTTIGDLPFVDCIGGGQTLGIPHSCGLDPPCESLPSVSGQSGFVGGQQMAFFLLQGLGAFVEHMVFTTVPFVRRYFERRPRAAAMYTFVWIFFTIDWFARVYFLSDYHRAVRNPVSIIAYLTTGKWHHS